MPLPPPDAEASHQTKGLLRLTMACNERCPFCNVPVEDYPRPTPEAAEIAAQLDAFVASGERTLTISGGEPTLLRRRLCALVAEARARGIPFVELQTNAILIDEAYAQELARAGLTSAFVSLLAPDAALHDRLAGLEGAFPRCLAGIDALLDAGLRVTLNPVFARPSQDLVAAYVDFVAARLPRVRSISLSAVQPHGRARSALEDLLPDYERLGPSVREARARARLHGIELLNPYCGLPLCVGWEEDLHASVEAVEAEAGGWRERPGIENAGDKRQGPPCRACALRTRCGGAWFAWWELRGGRGLAPPVSALPPWAEGGPGPMQSCARVPHEVSPAPTAWLHADRLGPLDLPALLASPTTDLAWQGPLSALVPGPGLDRPLVQALRRLDRVNAERGDSTRLRVWLRLEGMAALAEPALELARALGVHAVDLAGPAAERAPLLARRFPELLLRPA